LKYVSEYINKYKYNLFNFCFWFVV
jgi:hypothetical protein